MKTLVRFTDNWRDTCPGTVDGDKLIKIAVQKERRILKRLFKPIKNIIYLQEGTKMLWYKPSECFPAVIKMGISRKNLNEDSKSVPMEIYYNRLVVATLANEEWIKRNDFELV